MKYRWKRWLWASIPNSAFSAIMQVIWKWPWLGVFTPQKLANTTNQGFPIPHHSIERTIWLGRGYETPSYTEVWPTLQFSASFFPYPIWSGTQHVFQDLCHKSPNPKVDPWHKSAASTMVSLYPSAGSLFLAIKKSFNSEVWESFYIVYCGLPVLRLRIP